MRMNKFLFLLATVMFCQLSSFSKSIEIDGIYYDLDDSNKTAEVTYPPGNNLKYYTGIINIPETIQYQNNNYSVTSIGIQAFWAQDITNVILPKTIKDIKYRAFKSTVNLKNIVFSNEGNLKTIGYEAFYSCKSLTNISFPKSLETIEHNAFEYCSSLKTIDFASVRNIDKAAFKGCESLTDIVIPSSVVTIGDFCFNGCSQLKRVTIGEAVEYIGPDAFLDDKLLEEVTFKSKILKELGYEAFRGCWALTDVRLPDSLEKMGYGVFRFCVSLKNIYLGQNLKDIPSKAFEQSDIESITIPNSVESIGESAFIECLLLKNVIFGNGLKSINDKAFYSCASLESIILPEPLESIGGGTFSDCKNLKFVSIPRTCRSISNYAFSNCGMLDNVNDLASVPQDIYNRNVFTHSGSLGYVTVHVYKGLYDLYNTTLGWYDIPASKYYCYVKIVDDLEISAIESIQFSNDPIYCSVGSAGIASLKLYPENATSTQLIWSSGDPTVLFVDMYSGEFIGLKEGETTLTVSVEDNSSVSATAKVIITSMDGVGFIRDKEEDPIIYDLYGRRLKSLQKGINIVNGKKILIK